MGTTMNVRKDAEKLVDLGTWVNGYNTGRITFVDGTVIDLVNIDVDLNPNPKIRRVWLFFWRNVRFTSAELSQRAEQNRIAEWRRRSVR